MTLKELLKWIHTRYEARPPITTEYFTQINYNDYPKRLWKVTVIFTSIYMMTGIIGCSMPFFVDSIESILAIVVPFTHPKIHRIDYWINYLYHTWLVSDQLIIFIFVHIMFEVKLKSKMMIDVGNKEEIEAGAQNEMEKNENEAIKRVSEKGNEDVKSERSAIIDEIYEEIFNNDVDLDRNEPNLRDNNFDDPCVKNIESSETENRFKEIICLHCDIISTLSKVIKLHSTSIFLWETFMLSTHGTATIMIKMNPATILQLSLPLIIFTAQYLIISGFSSAIESSYDELSDAIYCSKWYLLPVKSQKIVLNIMVMAQKHVCLSVGGFADSNLERFTNV
uniref:CSON005022 protein n=1 Tax=Culicoides sonorensis TaxID=179676 RepID=A0A336LUD7_CULSO